MPLFISLYNGEDWKNFAGDKKTTEFDYIEVELFLPVGKLLPYIGTLKMENSSSFVKKIIENYKKKELKIKIITIADDDMSVSNEYYLTEMVLNVNYAYFTIKCIND